MMQYAQDAFLDVGPVWPKVIGSSAAILVFIAVWIAFSRAGTAVLNRMVPPGEVEPEEVDRRQRLQTLWTAMRRVFAVLFIAVAALTMLALWGLPIAPFLTFGGIVGVAIGFGAQSFVKDMISGFFIVAENQYALGDTVRISDVVGTVEDIRLRTTVLRDMDGNVHYVPNGTIGVASNFTQQFAVVVADVGVAYGEDINRVIEVLTDEAMRFSVDPEFADHFLEEPKVLGVQALGDWAVTVRVTLTVLADSRWIIKREFNRRVKVRLDAEGIEIPFPYRTIVQKNA